MENQQEQQSCAADSSQQNKWTGSQNTDNNQFTTSVYWDPFSGMYAGPGYGPLQPPSPSGPTIAAPSYGTSQPLTPQQMSAQPMGHPQGHPHQQQPMGPPQGLPHQQQPMGPPQGLPHQQQAMGPPQGFTAQHYMVPPMGPPHCTQPAPRFNSPATNFNQGSDSSHSVEQMPAMSTRGRRKVCSKKVKQENFKPEEDVLLCQTWAEISNDPVIDTGQRKEGLWARIEKRYNEQRGDYPERVDRSLSNKWDKIKACTSKFTKFYYIVIRQNQSGMNDHDMTLKAASDYALAQGHPFPYMHCWEILKNEPKWQQLPHDTAQDVLSGFAGASFSPSMDPAGACSTEPSSSSKRPIGRDSSKSSSKKAKSQAESSQGEFYSDLRTLVVEKYDTFKDSQGEKMKHFGTFLELEKERIELDREKIMLKKAKRVQEMEEELSKLLELDIEKVPERMRGNYERKKEKLLSYLENL